MNNLKFYPAASITELARPEKNQTLSLDTQAKEFLTDFKDTKPLIIDSSVSAIEVKNIMKNAHVRLTFVINEKSEFLGVICKDDLIDRKIIQKTSEGFNREDILVTDLMRKKQELSALDINEISTVTIGEVIEVLKDNGQQHCLVIDREANKIRGIFSASDLSRKLHLPIDIQEKSSFYKVFSAIA